MRVHPEPALRPAQESRGAEAGEEVAGVLPAPPQAPELEVSVDGRTVRAKRDGVAALATFGGDLPAGRCHRLSVALLPREGLGRVDLGPCPGSVAMAARLSGYHSGFLSC